MTKRRQATTRDKTPPMAVSEEEQIVVSNLSLHELFQQQTMAMLERTDLDEEQKQNILVAMSCPCCGGSAMSFTAKIGRR
jgi:hypothetical protein